MKRKIKKNTLVVMALSVMIGVAGYLNFSDNSHSSKKAKTPSDDNVEVINYQGNVSAATSGDAAQYSSVDTYNTPDDVDKVELNGDEDDIGKAVLTSAEIAKNNVATAKLNREQNRSKNLEALLSVINDENSTDARRQEAIDSYVELSDIIKMESDAETILTAKGFEDAIVTVNDSYVDVTLIQDEITDTEKAQIEDAVTRKTGYDIDKVVISFANSK